MRISDWSSDVCSSDLERHAVADEAEIARPELRVAFQERHVEQQRPGQQKAEHHGQRACGSREPAPSTRNIVRRQDRKSAVKGKSVSVRVVVGGRRILNKKNTTILRYKTKTNIK